MATAIENRHQFAIQVSLTLLQDRSTGHGRCPFKAREPVMLSIFVPACEPVRNIGLSLAQNVDGKHPRLLDEFGGARIFGQGHQNSQRSEGYRTERIAGHAMHFVAVPAGYHGHPRNKPRHDLPKLSAIWLRMLQGLSPATIVLLAVLFLVIGC